MKPERRLIYKFADESAKKITRKTISALQNIKDTLSGDDSGLINVWDEICVQVQYKSSFYWDAYDQMAHSFVLSFVEELKEHEKLALWFRTAQGWDWLYDHGDKDEDEDDGTSNIFYSDSDIEDYIVNEYLYRKAESWSNDRIRAYLSRCY